MVAKIGLQRFLTAQQLTPVKNEVKYLVFIFIYVII